MTAKDESSKWIAVEDYAAERDMPASEIVSYILDEKLKGRRIGDRWYIARPHVVLVDRASGESETGLLRISACRIGTYVTAGRGEFGIPLRLDDPGREAALVALNAAMRKLPVRPPELPVEIRLNGENFLFDSSLWLDLGAALVEYAVLMDPTVDE